MSNVKPGLLCWVCSGTGVFRGEADSAGEWCKECEGNGIVTKLPPLPLPKNVVSLCAYRKKRQVPDAGF